MKKIKHDGKVYDLTELHKQYPEIAILLKHLTTKVNNIIDEVNEIEMVLEKISCIFDKQE